MSTDPALIQSVSRASAGPVSTVARVPELIARIESGDCCIAVLDMELLGESIARCIADLERYANRVVVLAAADRIEAELLVGFLSDQRLHRLLIKPATAGSTRLLLDSAVLKYQRLLGRPGAALDETGTHFAPLPPRRPFDQRWAYTVAAAVAAFTLAGIVVATVAGLAGLRPGEC